MTEPVLSPINRAMDIWTVKTAAFCSARDAQLDVAEALPKIGLDTVAHAAKQPTVSTSVVKELA